MRTKSKTIRRSPRLNPTMAVQMTNEQFQQLLGNLAQPRTNRPTRSFTECTARYGGTRSHAAVEEFITATKVFRTMETISDEDALTGLPLLLTGEASQWWSGIKGTITTFDNAIKAIREAFAPPLPNFRIFGEIFNDKQPASMPTDKYITVQRERFSRLSGDLEETWQLDITYGLLRQEIRDRISRADVTTFEDLLKRARIIEANERDRKSTKEGSRYQPPESKPRAKCEYCRNFGHEAAVCRKKAREEAKPNQAPAAQTTPIPPPTSGTPIKCYGCGRVGVIRRNCPTCTATLSNSNHATVSFCSLDVQVTERPAVNISVGGIPGTAYLDSGARTSLASFELYKVLQSQHFTFNDVIINLIQADGKSTPTPIKTTIVPVNLQGREITTSFMVLPDAPDTKTLLGVDFHKRAGLVVDYNHNRWHFSGNRHQTYGFAAKDQPAPLPKTPTEAEFVDATAAMMAPVPWLSPLPPTPGRDTDTPAPAPRAPPVRMVCDHESNLSDGYGPSYGFEAPYEWTSLVSDVLPADTWSRTDYMWQDATEVINRFWDPSRKTDTSIEMGLVDFEDVALRPDEASHLNPQEKDKFTKILSKNVDLFRPDGPPTMYMEHHISTGTHAPVASPPYQTTPGRRKILEQEVQQLLRDQIVEECESPWSSPVVLVPKPDGSTRLCIDYRRLNAITTPDLYPLPRIEDLLHSTGSCPYISTMDLKSGYYQVSVSPADRDKTAFITPFGTYRFLRLPFGLRNAPATFQRLMDRFKTHLPGVRLLVYLDDLIVLSPDFETHLEDLRRCFEQLRKFQLRMHRKKCNFFCSRVLYLGHVISADGIQTRPDKVTAITQMPPPRNVKQLLTFLQTCNWYRRFIPQFANLARPLTNLTKKAASWVWKPAQEDAFNQLKTALTTAPILRQASPNEPYKLRTDASAYALGAVLLQGDGTDERPVEYASRLLSPAERNYSTTEREALALVWSVRKFRGYLEEATTILITDHQPLKWLMSLKSPSGRLARWALQLQPYNLTIEYAPGKANQVADTLSRPPITNDLELNLVTIDLPRKTATQVRERQLQDGDLLKIIRDFEEDRPETVARWTNRGYLMSDGVLYHYCHADETEEPQLVVASVDRPALMKELHDAPEAGHYGADRTYYKMSQRFFWPGMRRSIREYVQKCSACQRYKASNQKPAGLLQTPVMNQRFEVLSIDLFGPLPPADEGKTWILVVEDTCSRWVELFALKQATAEACARTLLDEVILRFGVPRRLISDNGTQFISGVMQQLCYCLGIEQKFTPVYHPAANPVERKNRDLKPRLSLLLGHDHTGWPEKLPAIRFALNSSLCQSTGTTAAYLTFGRHLRHPVEVHHDLRAIIQNENILPEITPHLLHMATTLEEAKEINQKEQDRQKQYGDAHRQPAPAYQPGDLVLVTSHPISKSDKAFSAKFAPKRDGPYVVLASKGPCSYEIATRDDPATPLGVHHVSDLSPFKGEPAEAPVVQRRRRGRPRKQIS